MSRHKESLANNYAQACARTFVILAFAWMSCVRGTEGQTARKRPECVSSQDPKVLQQRESELRGAANKLLQAFRTGDTAAFLALVHPLYFSEEEGENFPIAKLRKSFRTKDWMYCTLFDSSCLSPEEAGSFTSFSELAKRPEARILYAQLTTGKQITDPGCRALVTFSWTDPTDNLYVSGFGYMYRHGEWKVTGFDLPPSKPPVSKAPNAAL